MLPVSNAVHKWVTAVIQYMVALPVLCILCIVFFDAPSVHDLFVQMNDGSDANLPEGFHKFDQLITVAILLFY